jgi:hypothetical protein
VPLLRREGFLIRIPDGQVLDRTGPPVVVKRLPNHVDAQVASGVAVVANVAEVQRTVLHRDVLVVDVGGGAELHPGPHGLVTAVGPSPRRIVASVPGRHVDGPGAVDGKEARVVAAVVVHPPHVLLPPAPHDAADLIDRGMRHLSNLLQRSPPFRGWILRCLRVAYRGRHESQQHSCGDEDTGGDEQGHQRRGVIQEPERRTEGTVEVKNIVRDGSPNRSMTCIP